MKVQHTRNLSASQNTSSYYSNLSPGSSTYKKREQPNVLHTFDLKMSLNLRNKNLTKTNDVKIGKTAASANKFNFQTKLGPSLILNKSSVSSEKSSDLPNQVAKKHFLLHNKEYDIGQSERTTREEESGQIDKKYYESNPLPVKNNAKAQTVIAATSFGMSDLFQSDYLSKFKKKQSEMKKGSPRGPSTPGPQSKQIGHSKNKKSFDLATLQTIGKTNLSDIFMKPSSVKNSIRVDVETYKYKAISNNETKKPQSTTSQVKGPGLEKSPTMSTVRVNNYLSLKHKRAPSYDILASKKQGEILNGSDVQMPRKSSSIINPKSVEVQMEKKFQKRCLKNLRFSVRSRAGATQTGARKTNQDSYIAQSNFGENPNRHLFGVCDGHGTNGHLVSNFVKETLPRYLLVDSQIETKPDVTFTNIFELCHQKLLFCDFDTRFSGTTCINILINDNKIISANAGDSRAVMGFYDKEWDYLPLSSDHKPNLVTEAQRILMAGGRIDSFKDDDGNPIGPSRVWLKDQEIPGLAMSRSIGDVVASTVGVTCRPEVQEFEITDDDKFIIIASDGVWEFIENMEAIKIVAPFYEKNDLEGACDCLLEAALSRWEQEEDNVVDDITLIIAFF